MNSLIRNKKKARRAAATIGHKMGKCYNVGRYILSRCIACDSMLYVAGKTTTHLYGKTMSGDALKHRCLGYNRYERWLEAYKLKNQKHRRLLEAESV